MQKEEKQIQAEIKHSLQKDEGATHMQSKAVKKKKQREEKHIQAEMKHSHRTVGKERGRRKGSGRRERAEGKR